MNHSVVRSSPSSKDTSARQSRSRSAADTSAHVWRTSPGTRVGVLGFGLDAEQPPEDLEQIEQRVLVAARDVVGAAGGLRGRTRSRDVGGDHVTDVGEVAALLAVAVHGRRPSLAQGPP